MTLLSKHYFVASMQVDFFDDNYTLDDFVASIDALPVSPRSKNLTVNTGSFAIAPKLSSSDHLVVTPTPDIHVAAKPRKGSQSVTIASLKEELDELRIQMQLTHRELFTLYEKLYIIIENKII
jgi:hypothetical protein